MSKFWYFLGGCAAGALAVAAVQTFTEESYSSSSSSSRDDEDDVAETLAAPLCAENSAENREAAVEGMKTMTTVMADAAASAGFVTPAGEMPDMQKMSEQLASSVIGIVGEFLRQSQAAQQHRQNAAETALSPEYDGGSRSEDLSVSPITPNLGAAQA